MIITIDGYCCQGKSFIGGRLAEELGLEFLATGRIVRYVAFLYTRLQDGRTKEAVLLERAVEQMKRTDMGEIVRCGQLETPETEHAMRTAAHYPFVFEQVVQVIRSYAGGRDMVLDGRFTFSIFPHAHRSYYFRSSLERRARLAMQSGRMNQEEAMAYLRFRDSFEKRYDIPARVRMVDLDYFSKAEELVAYLKQDVRSKDQWDEA